MGWLPVAMSVALTTGVAAGVLVPGLDRVALGVGIAAWIVAVAAWRCRQPHSGAAAGLIGLVGFGGALGGSAMTTALSPPLVRVISTRVPLSPYGARSDVTVRLAGRLRTDAVPVARATAVRLAVERVWIDPAGDGFATSGDVWLSIAGDAATTARVAWRAGRVVEVEAALRRPTAFRNPGDSAPRYQMARRRLALIGSVKSAHLVEVRAAGRWWEEVASAIRADARQALRRHGGGGPDAAAVGAAVLLGDRAGLAPDLEDRLQRAGTIHVIAISGGNIAVWAVMATWLVSVATRRRGVAFAALAVVLSAYAMVVGGGASVLRATGMAIVGAAARWLDQRTAAINVLALAAGGLVMSDPLLVVDLGFWLTTVATVGLILGLPARAAGESRLRSWTRTLVLASCAAETALLPIVALVFQQVTLAGVFVSTVAVPSMAALQLAALGVVVADSALPAVAGLCGQLLAWTTLGVTESARLVDIWPWLAWRVPPPAWPIVTGYYAALGLLVWARASQGRWASRRVWRAALAAVATIALWIAVSPSTLLRWPTGRLSITALDVGQGDATLIAFPSGQRLLVDAGGILADGDLGGRVVGPALRAMGHRRLDIVVVTHADLDHVGGAATLIREFRPAEVWTGIPVADHAPSAALRAAADAVGAAWREARRGERVTIGGVELRLLHPPPPDWERQRVRNDDSLVLDVRFGAVRVVLPGDIGHDVEDDLLRAGTAAGDDNSRLTVLKVAHHGSPGATSRAWLAAVRPRLALISAGAANPFGHPSAAVLSRLDEVGAEVWRTDRDGAIHLTTDGRGVVVNAASGRRTVISPRRRRPAGPASRWPRHAWPRPTARSADRASARRGGGRRRRTAFPCA